MTAVGVRSHKVCVPCESSVYFRIVLFHRLLSSLNLVLCVFPNIHLALVDIDRHKVSKRLCVVFLFVGII